MDSQRLGDVNSGFQYQQALTLFLIGILSY